mmetsp:Transcript_1145/g.2531  ORF Transcript_1145/g.2531 Transcript_1145/m.2531 type:complete len:256 (+) Transcript_1145:379-1146(+)
MEVLLRCCRERWNLIVALFPQGHAKMVKKITVEDRVVSSLHRLEEAPGESTLVAALFECVRTRLIILTARVNQEQLRRACHVCSSLSQPCCIAHGRASSTEEEASTRGGGIRNIPPSRRVHIPSSPIALGGRCPGGCQIGHCARVAAIEDADHLHILGQVAIDDSMDFCIEDEVLRVVGNEIQWDNGIAHTRRFCARLVGDASAMAAVMEDKEISRLCSLHQTLQLLHDACLGGEIRLAHILTQRHNVGILKAIG